jgi:hypothetical protein
VSTTTVPASPSRRIPARAPLTQDELAAVRERVEGKGVALIAPAWAVILGSVAPVAAFPDHRPVSSR